MSPNVDIPTKRESGTTNWEDGNDGSPVTLQVVGSGPATAPAALQNGFAALDSVAAMEADQVLTDSDDVSTDDGLGVGPGEELDSDLMQLAVGGY